MGVFWVVFLVAVDLFSTVFGRGGFLVVDFSRPSKYIKIWSSKRPKKIHRENPPPVAAGRPRGPHRWPSQRHEFAALAPSPTAPQGPK